MRKPYLVFLVLALPMGGAFVACSGDDATSGGAPGDSGAADSGTADSTLPSDAGTDTAADTSSGDAGNDTGAGVVVVPFDPTGTGSPDALFWDDATQKLYITDDGNAIWTWTDKDGLTKAFTVPSTSPDGGTGKLNGIVGLPDGTLLVTQFGFGSYGGIQQVFPDGGVQSVPNVPGGGRRIAIVRDPTTGTIYSDSFQKVGSNLVGVVETVDVASGTTTIASGFQKPVGLLVQGGTLFVVDQNVNTIYALPTSAGSIGDGGLADGAAYPTFATLPSPDQLTGGPNGSFFTGQFKPTVDGGTPEIRQVFADGGVSTLGGATYTSLSDVAYDATNKRLFVVDSNGTTLRTIKIVPVL
jgi:hypothetical protein